MHPKEYNIDYVKVVLHRSHGYFFGVKVKVVPEVVSDISSESKLRLLNL